MESLYLLIPISVLLVFVIGVLFWWSLRSGQYDDLRGPPIACSWMTAMSAPQPGRVSAKRQAIKRMIGQRAIDLFSG